MPSESKAQSRFFHSLENAKEHPDYMKKLTSKARKAAEGMSLSTIKEFTTNKTNNLPEKKAFISPTLLNHVKEAARGDFIRKMVGKVTDLPYARFGPLIDNDRINEIIYTSHGLHNKLRNMDKFDVRDNFRRYSRSSSDLAEDARDIRNVSKFYTKKASPNPEELMRSLPPEMLAKLQSIFDKPRTRISPSFAGNQTNVNVTRQPNHVQVLPPNYQHPSSIKIAYIKSFIKKSFDAGLTVEGTQNLMEKSGFVKEAFLPFLIDMAAMLGGGFGADYLGGKLALRAAALRRARGVAADSLPGGIYGPKLDPVVTKAFNLKATPKINTWEDRGNDIVQRLGQLHQNHPWVFGTAGSTIPMAAVAPITGAMRGEEQPPIQDPSGGQQIYG